MLTGELHSCLTGGTAAVLIDLTSDDDEIFTSAAPTIKDEMLEEPLLMEPVNILQDITEPISQNNRLSTIPSSPVQNTNGGLLLSYDIGLFVTLL